MAARKARPGRSLVIFFLGVAILYGLVALAGSWKPQLGLDLQGGTRIILSADGDPTPENLEEARRIIDQRVNGRGVAEAEVTTQGGTNIIVEVPGNTENRRELEEAVMRTAQLRFRLVACGPGSETRCAGGAGTLPGVSRPAPFQADETESPSAEPTGSPTAEPSDDGSTAPTDEPTDEPSGEPDEPDADQPDPNSVESAIAFMRSPDPESVALYNQHTCDAEGRLLDAEGKPAEVEDDPTKPLVACGDPVQGPGKFLLSPSVIEGTELTDASSGTPQGQFEWVVNISMGNDKEKALPKGSPGAEDDFEKVTEQLSGTGERFAIVLDAQVISAPEMNDPIRDGNSQISGNFTESTSRDLANSLKFGALPIAFSDERTTVEEIGPSLAGDQLTAGLTAGGVGLGLVMLYCLLYYRALGTVVFASLLVAAAITYAMVLLLGETAGFTLTLPGIAGLIIAVGITADSFIIFFERIRDEMREGKSMRVAVETGWARARITRFAANTVSLMSALVLYIFATGVVKGFGFALGLSTLIDLAVLFWFTKPAVSWLAQFRLFNSGNKLSGLSPETLGIDRPVTRSQSNIATAGGDA